MIVSCPACATKYRLKPESLGTEGRKVRCQKCGEVWLQKGKETLEAKPAELVSAGESPEPPAPQAASAAAKSEASPQAPAAAAVKSADKPKPQVTEKAPDERPRDAKPQGKSVPEAADQARRVPAAGGGKAAKSGGSSILSAVGSGARGRLGRLREQSSDSAGGRAVAEQRKAKAKAEQAREAPHIGSIGWIVFVVFAVAIVALLWAGRARIVEALPSSGRLYALVGLEVGVPGEGFALQNVRSIRRVVDGKPVLSIVGIIANTSNEGRDIPPLRGSLMDEDGQLLHSWTFEADDEHLDAGERTTFSTDTNNPPPEAVDFAVAFTAARD
jgi:predicted Zn finger-like uncharacterized protein